MELVTGDGSVRRASPPTDDPDAFAAAQVSVGALGAVSTLILQCVPGVQPPRRGGADP